MSFGIHTLIAYKCIFKEPYKRSVLGSISQEKFISIMNGFNDYLCESSKDSNMGKVMFGKDNIFFRDIAPSVIGCVMTPDIGIEGEGFDVAHISTGTRQHFSEDYSAIYSHIIHAYYSDGFVYFVFYRNGLKGCKTITLYIFNEYLKTIDLYSHFELLFSNDVSDMNIRTLPKTLTLTRRVRKADSASNLIEKTNEVERELVVYLNAPRNNDILEKIRSFFRGITGQEDVEQYISARFQDDYDESKLSVKFGNSLKTISLNEFTGLLAEYDITDKVEYVGKKVTASSITTNSNEYIMMIINQRDE